MTIPTRFDGPIAKPALQILGPYTAGEIPEPLVIVFRDAPTMGGLPVNLSGAEVALWVQRAGDPDVEVWRTGGLVTDGTDGRGYYQWQPGDLAVPDTYLLQLWAQTSERRYASPVYQLIVHTGPVGLPVGW